MANNNDNPERLVNYTVIDTDTLAKYVVRHAILNTLHNIGLRDHGDAHKLAAAVADIATRMSNAVEGQETYAVALAAAVMLDSAVEAAREVHQFKDITARVTAMLTDKLQ